MYSLKKSNITVHQCHDKVLCSPLRESTACHVQGSVLGSEPSGLLGSVLAKVTIPRSQAGLWISAASSAQPWQTGRKSTRVGCSVCRLGGILAPETQSHSQTSLRSGAGLVFTYLQKKSDKVKKLRGHYENGTRAESGSQGTD